MFVFSFGLCVQGLKVTMKKHPSAFKLCGYLAETVKTVGEEPMTLYEGELCGLRESQKVEEVKAAEEEEVLRTHQDQYDYCSNLTTDRSRARLVSSGTQ